MDGGHVRSLGRVLGGVAESVRTAGERVAGAQGVSWTSLAAREYRADLAAESGRLRRCVAELDDAVAAVLRHAAALDAGAAR